MTPESLRSAREALGLTQRQIARIAGLSRSRVTQLENGYRFSDRGAALVMRGIEVAISRRAFIAKHRPRRVLTVREAP